VIVRHSTRLEPGEAVMIEAFDLADGLVLDLIAAVHGAGAVPYVQLRDNAVLRQVLLGATEAQMRLQAAIDRFQMEQVQAYVGIRGAMNSSELADVPADRLALFTRLVQQPVHLDYRVNHTKWVVRRWPT